MTDFNELMKQARQMQEQLQRAQQEAANTVLVGESGAGLVRVHMNGRHDVQKVELDSGLLTEDKDVIEDLIAAAINDVVKKLEEKNRDNLSGMASGFKLPEGFKFPF
ncbi:MAG: YbaB/EbfC family nucleoid-associated protein [Pseudomonadales bacterium]|nr:YbaB/EbfC family nucleoid-associated protein [Pseudomonadales bacterium]MCP5357232.1 YbaB/EbfC family nucleoid-associated protein [Pseudomonadales bacterium]